MWRRMEGEAGDRMWRMCIEFTGDHERYGAAMERVVKEWPRTMLNSLTSPSTNKRAFVGHCACCFDFNCPEYITRMAWKQLTDQQRTLADAVAQKIIDAWTAEYSRQGQPLHFVMGNSVLC